MTSAEGQTPLHSENYVTTYIKLIFEFSSTTGVFLKSLFIKISSPCSHSEFMEFVMRLFFIYVVDVLTYILIKTRVTKEDIIAHATVTEYRLF